MGAWSLVVQQLILRRCVWPLGIVINLTQLLGRKKSKMILRGVMSGQCYFPGSSYFLNPIEKLEIKSYPRHKGTVFI